MSKNGSSTEMIFNDTELGVLMSKKDWSKTILGDPKDWCVCLKVTLCLIMNSLQPLCMSWGEEGIFLYNDAYMVILGDKHPWALGASIQTVWAEVWEFIRPSIQQVMQGISVVVSDQAFYLRRSKELNLEEAFFCYSYTPLLDEGFDFIFFSFQIIVHCVMITDLST